MELKLRPVGGGDARLVLGAGGAHHGWFCRNWADYILDPLTTVGKNCFCRVLLAMANRPQTSRSHQEGVSPFSSSRLAGSLKD